MIIDYHMHLERGPFSEEWFEKFWNVARGNRNFRACS
jgi:hypothetical protein